VYRSTPARWSTESTPSIPLDTTKRTTCANRKAIAVIVLGIILLLAGFILKISILWTIGIILVVVGLVLTVLGSMGRAVGGRRTYY
jgi:hypothetical protein